MKLLELVGVKKFYDADIEDVLKSMGTHEELGRGTFGVTLKHGTKPEVVKFWITDSSYDDFINYVLAHPYKHFPKLLSKPKMLSAFFLRTKDFPEKVRYVKMEVLQRIKGRIDADVINDIFYGLRDDCASKKDVDEYIGRYLTEPNMTFNKKYLDRLNEMVPNVPEFCHAMFDMLHHVLKGKNELDIHDENIMLRANGEIVITDPVYNTRDMAKADEIKTAFYDLKKDSERAVKGKTPGTGPK